MDILQNRKTRKEAISYLLNHHFSDVMDELTDTDIEDEFFERGLGSLAPSDFNSDELITEIEKRSYKVIRKKDFDDIRNELLTDNPRLANNNIEKLLFDIFDIR